MSDVSLETLRDLYLGLMQEVLLNSIYRDPPTRGNFFRGPRYSSDKRNVGKDWPSQAHTMIGRERLTNIRYAIETTLAEGVPGNFIETGVWRGGGCIFARAVLKAHAIIDRKVFVADSFRGLPPPDAKRYPADRGATYHTKSELAVSKDQVAANFNAYGLLDDCVEFVEGFFEETLSKGDFGALAVARLDGDMYGSTIVALQSLYPRLSSGGFLIIDDYALPECRQAVDDFRRQNGIDIPIVQIDWTGVYWRKDGDAPKK